MVILPDQYSAISTYDLVEAVARGRIGFDHRVLRTILDRGTDAVPDLVRFGNKPPKDDEFDLSEELIAIFRHLRTPDAMPFFLEYIRRDPHELSDQMVPALYPIREAAVEPLMQLYDELGEENGGEVLFLLAALGIRDDRILTHLVERLEYDLVDATISLSLYGDPAARPALEKALQEVGDDVHLRRNVEDALSSLGRNPDIPEDEWSIWDDFPERSLPEFRDMDARELLEYLDSSDADYRLGAANSIGATEATDELIDKVLELAKTDPDPRVRGACWEALSDEIENKQIRSSMLARLSDETTPIAERVGALLGLASEASEAPVRSYVEQFYSRDETRAAAMRAMWNSMDRGFGKYFPKHLDDDDPEVLDQAILGVGYLGVHESADRLRKFFDDEDRRPAALLAYTLALRHEISKGRIPALYRKVEEAAGGLDEEEESVVKLALDQRLMMHGQPPVYNTEEFADVFDQAASSTTKVGRNDPCPCGSGKKYKKCCGAE